MYAVIRAGGKQYRVSPGDVIRIERQAPTGKDGSIEFTDILAVSPEQGKLARLEGEKATVSGKVVEEGRADKILVFHYKRKKQYKRLRGHRQPFTAVRITEITFDGQRFTAPAEERKPQPKPAKAKAAAEEAEPHAKAAKPAAKKAAKPKAAAKKAKPSPKKKK
ncbi:MAG: 50S ribosomal protein L21 [Acidobacteriales bacterium]|nr:50S ribosomal protein L21 [Terriglobales bacterium]